jgi:hypothetical protein
MYPPTPGHRVTDLPANGQSPTAVSGLSQTAPRRKRRRSLGEQAGKELIPAKIYRSTLHAARILAAFKEMRISAYVDALVRREACRERDKVSQLLGELLAEGQEPPEIAGPPQ